MKNERSFPQEKYSEVSFWVIGQLSKKLFYCFPERPNFCVFLLGGVKSCSCFKIPLVLDVVIRLFKAILIDS